MNIHDLISHSFYFILRYIASFLHFFSFSFFISFFLIDMIRFGLVFLTGVSPIRIVFKSEVPALGGTVNNDS